MQGTKEKIRKTISGSDVLICFLLITVLFAGLILMCFVPFYFYFNDYVAEATIDSYREKLDIGVSQLDNTFSTLSNTVQATVEDSDYRIFRYSTPTTSLDPTKLPAMSETLHNLLFSDPLVSDAGILFSSNVIIDRERSYYGSQYYSLYPNFLACEELTEDEWRAAMEASRPLMAEKRYTSGHNYAAGASRGYDALTYSSYWTNGNYRTKSVFYATLPSDKLLACLSDADVIHRGSVEIRDTSGNVLLSRAGEEADDVSYVSATTKNHSLRIAVGIPNSIIYEQMQSFRHLIQIYIVGTLFFALLLSVLFANHLSKPLTRLKAAILGSRHLSAGYKQNAESGERFFKLYTRQFDQLSQTFLSIDSRTEEYESTISVQLASIRTMMLERALHRGLEDIEAFHRLFPDFPSSYRLCMLRFESAENATLDSAAPLQANMAAAVRSYLGNIIIHPTDGDMLALIIPSAPEADEVARIQQLRTHLAELTVQPIGCVISDVFSEAEQLLDAYQQTQFLYAAFADVGLLHYEQMKDLAPQKRLMPLTYAKLGAIYTALYSGNVSSALYILEECSDEICNTDVSLQQHIYSQLCVLIAHIRMENPVLLCDLAVPTFDSGMSLPRNFAPCFETISSKLAMEREDQSMMFSRQIMDYINENIYSTELYLQSVLAHFQISAPTLQKMVKLSTGQTFASYIEEKRLENALKMVIDSEATFQEIATRCGFISTNTFYKSFRRKFGKSPQDMRKTNP